MEVREKAINVVSDFINIDTKIETVGPEIFECSTGYYYSYDSSAGCKFEREKWTIIFKDGRKKELPYASETHEYGSNHISDEEWREDFKIGDFITDTDEVFAIVRDYYYNCDWEDFGHCKEVTVYFLDEKKLEGVREEVKKELIEKIEKEDNVAKLVALSSRI